MENITLFSLNQLKELRSFNDLVRRDEALQNLSYFLQRRQEELKAELSYPLFWANYESSLNQSIKLHALYESSLNLAQKKISIYKRLDDELFEEDILSPQEIIRLLSYEKITDPHRQILEVFCSYAPVFLSLNFILNLE